MAAEPCGTIRLTDDPASLGVGIIGSACIFDLRLESASLYQHSYLIPVAILLDWRHGHWMYDPHQGGPAMKLLSRLVSGRPGFGPITQVVVRGDGRSLDATCCLESSGWKTV